ncbi:hypothetical protein HWV62_44959 [Athelia sp. TMB]|nr:hypothetical protein HWV62_44959 [Athelia sp. TMB]
MFPVEQSRPRILKLFKDEQARLSAPVTPKHARIAKKRKLSGSYEGEMAPGSDGIELIPGPSTATLRRSCSNTTGDDEDDAGLPVVPTSDSVEEFIEEGNKRVKEQAINAHIDRDCQSPPPISASSKGKQPPSKKKLGDDAKNQWNKLLSGKGEVPVRPSKGGKGKEKSVSVPFLSGAIETFSNSVIASNPEERLPKVTYALCNDRQLKAALSDLGLPTTGNRQDLESRHSRYLMLYNSNLDKSAAQRKTTAQLRSDLHQQEQQLIQAKKREKERASTTKAIVDDPVKYVRNNKIEFNKLIAQARVTPVKHKTAAAKAPLTPSTVLSSKYFTAKLPEHASGDDAIIIDSEEEVEM